MFDVARFWWQKLAKYIFIADIFICHFPSLFSHDSIAFSSAFLLSLLFYLFHSFLVQLFFIAFENLCEFHQYYHSLIRQDNENAVGIHLAHKPWECVYRNSFYIEVAFVRISLIFFSIFRSLLLLCFGISWNAEKSEIWLNTCWLKRGMLNI